MNYEALTAIGTVGAVALAVLGSVFRYWLEWRRRPVLLVRYRNIEPWRRLTSDVATSQHFLFFRVSVENIGGSVASGVRGIAADLTDQNGKPSVTFDPVALHWAGMNFDVPPEIDILPGQKEYLDVIQIPMLVMNPDALAAYNQFSIVASSTLPRGVQLTHFARGQTVKVRVAGRNVPYTGVELALPDGILGKSAGVTSLVFRLVELSDPYQNIVGRWHRHTRSVGL